MSYVSKILIADDDPVARENLEVLLTKDGYELSFAQDGLEALAKATAMKPDLLLLDVMMPHMDGFAVCKKLRSQPETAEMPIVMLTALDDRQSRLMGIHSGTDDFISKPLDYTELRLRIKTILRLNRYRLLLAERTRFDQVVQQAEVGYLMINDADEIVFANSQARLYLQLSPENEPITETFREQSGRFYHFEPESLWSNWPNDTPQQEPRYLIRPETKKSHILWLKVVTLGYSPHKNEPVQLIRLEDVTSQMIAELDIYNFQIMIKHKLRTPLIYMLGSMELAVNYADRLTKEEMKDLANIALKGFKRLRGDVENILRYVDTTPLVTTGNGTHITAIPALIKQVATQLELPAIRIAAPSFTNQQVSVTMTALELVLWELLGNAQKFHPQNTPNIEVSLQITPQNVFKLFISDDGSTLTPEQLARVWQPYYQAEKRFTGEVMGMGLGLSVVAFIMWSLGGHCNMYNRPDKSGTTVELNFPVTHES